MNPQTAAGASLKIQSKGAKQMSQFRYGPVRAVQQTGIPHAYASGGVSGTLKSSTGVLGKQRRSNQGTPQSSRPVTGSTVKQRPSSSKPVTGT